MYKELAAIAPNEYIFCVYSSYGHFLGPPASLVAIGDALSAAYASAGQSVTIRKNGKYPPLVVGDVFDNSPNGHIMRGMHLFMHGKDKNNWGPMGTSDFALYMFKAAF
jgi:hypothetical protein